MAVVGALIAANITLRYPALQPLLHLAPALPEIFSLGSGGSNHTISGNARIIDGDTIEINGTRIRLYGIDAPEMSQKCRIGQANVACGREAANALASQIGSASISCDEKDRDRYGRVVAVCSAAGTDLNGWMVERGYAVAYRQYSTDYVAAESRASQGKVGLWQYDFEMPWNWRHRGGQRPQDGSHRSQGLWVSPPDNPMDAPTGPGWVTPRH